MIFYCSVVRGHIYIHYCIQSKKCWSVLLRRKKITKTLFEGVLVSGWEIKRGEGGNLGFGFFVFPAPILVWRAFFVVVVVVVVFHSF